MRVIAFLLLAGMICGCGTWKVPGVVLLLDERAPEKSDIAALVSTGSGPKSATIVDGRRYMFQALGLDNQSGIRTISIIGTLDCTCSNGQRGQKSVGVGPDAIDSIEWARLTQYVFEWQGLCEGDGTVAILSGNFLGHITTQAGKVYESPEITIDYHYLTSASGEDPPEVAAGGGIAPQPKSGAGD